MRTEVSTVRSSPVRTLRRPIVPTTFTVPPLNCLVLPFEPARHLHLSPFVTLYRALYPPYPSYIFLAIPPENETTRCSVWHYIGRSIGSLLRRTYPELEIWETKCTYPTENGCCPEQNVPQHVASCTFQQVRCSSCAALPHFIHNGLPFTALPPSPPSAETPRIARGQPGQPLFYPARHRSIRTPPPLVRRPARHARPLQRGRSTPTH